MMIMMQKPGRLGLTCHPQKGLDLSVALGRGTESPERPRPCFLAHDEFHRLNLEQYHTQQVQRTG